LHKLKVDKVKVLYALAAVTAILLVSYVALLREMAVVPQLYLIVVAFSMLACAAAMGVLIQRRISRS
jgi:hypothetical protein